MQMDSAGEFMTSYAPANFPDVEIDIRPPNTLVNSVSNLAIHHIDSIEKHQSKSWRRKMRDIIENHQETILEFFMKPMPESHPLKYAHSLLIKYGKIQPSERSPVFLKDILVDISSRGLNDLNTYMEGLLETRVKESIVSKWLTVSKHLLDYMRDVGDELIRIDQRLKDQCSHLDSAVELVKKIVDLPGPTLDGFQTMMESFVEKQFEHYPIQNIYWDYIYTLQKYSALRDILMPQRLSNISEPTCCICMTEAIVMAMVPCGHTFCTNCSKKTIVCHICRQVVTSRLRIYFG